MNPPLLLSETLGQVRVLRLNRPAKANALNVGLSESLGRSLIEAEADSGIRCVVLTGVGDKAFCAGMDLADFARGTGSPSDPEGFGAFRRLMRGGAEIPTIAAVNASAIAGGFELVLGCDLAVASEEARFGVPETKRGLFAAGGGVFLGARIPLAVALELNLTGDLIDAARAYELGLVNRVTAPSEALAEAIRLAELIARNGPLAVRAARQIVRAAEGSLAQAQQLWEEWQPKVFGSADAIEGATAFVEKRAPVWTGH
jgi:enoyl-CoA hydratase/carnithine racemase